MTRAAAILKMKITLSLLSIFLLVGCRWLDRYPAQSVSPSSNPEIKVELVLINDGVKVYRFHDGVRYIYYTDARGSTQWTETQGKIQVPVRVETVK